MNTLFAIVASVMAFFTGLFTPHVIPEIQQAQQPTITVATSTAISAIVYKNEKYGFTLTFPEAWKGYRVTDGVGLGGQTKGVTFGIKDKDDMFSVNVYTKEEWEAYSKERTLPGMYIAENGKYVFAYSGVNYRSDDKDYVDKLAEWAEPVVYTFSFVNEEPKYFFPFQSDSNLTLLTRDNYNVYFMGKRIKDADPESFTLTKDGLLIDSRHVFTWHADHFDALAGADPLTIIKVGKCSRVWDNSAQLGEPVDSSYYRDKDHIYPDLETSTLDAGSFVYLGAFFTGAHQESGGKTADYAGFAKDKNGVYVGCGTKIEGANTATFSILDYGYSKDNQHVYFLDKIVKGADPKTFKPTEPDPY